MKLKASNLKTTQQNKPKSRKIKIWPCQVFPFIPRQYQQPSDGIACANSNCLCVPCCPRLRKVSGLVFPSWLIRGIEWTSPSEFLDYRLCVHFNSLKCKRLEQLMPVFPGAMNHTVQTTRVDMSLPAVLVNLHPYWVICSFCFYAR